MRPKMSQSQQERLAFIEFRLLFLGVVCRLDVCQRFGIAPAAATRDFALYRHLAPDNLQRDGASKHYRIGDDFQAIFEHRLERVLSTLSLGFGDGLGGSRKPLVLSDLPSPINRPALDVLAAISRAIHGGHALAITYHSNSSGRTDREIVPLALVDSGLRWHVRAFDRKSLQFRDFVLTRIGSPARAMGEVEERELSAADNQWNRFVDLELVPHPAHARPEVVEMDFGMKGGVLSLHVRAAVAGYVLRRWNVDCSPDHALAGLGVVLWLRNPLALYGVDSAVLAPSFVPAWEMRNE